MLLPLAGQIEGESQYAIHAAFGEDSLLHGNLVVGPS